ncbi:MAG: glutamate racemase [Anaerolineae bacterium]|nr:glutamate racemase [Anaerolineae bacterium]
MTIGIFDSGVGGLSVWREIDRLMPAWDVLYVADQAHVPYGPRPLAQVRRFSEGVARFLIDQGSAVVVVACNTASAAALQHLRHTFPHTPFVGMEPAVKPAVENTHTGRVGVIATQATFQGELFAALLERFAAGVTVLTQVCPGLVEAVEAGALDTPETERLLRSCLSPLIEGGIDQLVLGCTHYPFLQPLIARIVGPGVEIIDPAPAVARQTGRVLEQMGLRPIQGTGCRTFYTTGSTPAFAAMVERLVGGSGSVKNLAWDNANCELGIAKNAP